MIDTTTISTYITQGPQDASSPDYRCKAYQRALPFWQLCKDMKAGTQAIRGNRLTYLPKFENEDQKDYDARVYMTFANDHYAQTLSDHVGLIFAKMPELADDVSDTMEALLENIDGEGTHWQVFLQTAMEAALDQGHAGILTDYPENTAKNAKQATAMKLRPYCTLYHAEDIISWKTVTVGGIRVLVQVVLREDFEADDGNYGAVSRQQYRVLKQEVLRDDFGTVLGLGTVSWELHREIPTSATDKTLKLQMVSSGTVKTNAPEPVIPFRIIYGGPRIATLETLPHLLQLAYINLQETQLESDYAMVMHKCNVPTPVFIGRQTMNGKKGVPIQMGKGIDIPVGGHAMFLEPTGVALKATRERLNDIREQMKRQGAFVMEGLTGKTMTATEAALYMRQRNARLVRSARSMQDATEGMMQDLASFMQNEVPGSILFDIEFASNFDTAFAALCLQAYTAGVLPLEATLTVLATGKLPEDFNPEDIAIRMMVDAGNAINNNPEGDLSGETIGGGANPEGEPTPVPAKPPAPNVYKPATAPSAPTVPVKKTSKKKVSSKKAPKSRKV